MKLIMLVVSDDSYQELFVFDLSSELDIDNSLGELENNRGSSLIVGFTDGSYNTLMKTVKLKKIQDMLKTIKEILVIKRDYL